MGSEKNCVRQMQRACYCKVTLVLSLTQKTLTQEQTAKKKKKKKHEQKVKAKEKKGTGVMEDKAKKFWKILFLQSSFCGIYTGPKCCLCPTRTSGNFFTYQTIARHV